MSLLTFSYSEASLRHFAAQVLDIAQQAGATAAEVDISEGAGETVTVRLGQIETIEHHRDKELSVTLFFGQRRGHASTSDLSEEAIRSTVEAAATLARYTEEDPYAGLADPARLFKGSVEQALYFPKEISVEELTELALRAEAAARAVSPEIKNSEGAQMAVGVSNFVYANSNGFVGGYPSSHYSTGCTVIAGEGDGMQRDYWYSSARDFADLESVDAVGRTAGQRTLRRLHPKKLKSMRVPVLFEAPIAGGLIGSFVGAVSGGALYRGSSFLPDSLGEAVFAPHVDLIEDPFVEKGLASSPFDGEGVATVRRHVVKAGVVQGYFLGSYSARKLGLATTGNAGGAHNLILSDTGHSFEALLREMGTGFLVTDLLGHGVNPVTGDYSRGAAGFWVENGVIAYPVQEITIAGNLKEMFRGISAIGTDRLTRGSRYCGSILVDAMQIAGD